MDSQFSRQSRVWNSAVGSQYSFKAHSAICQVSLAAKYDHDKWATPLAEALVAITRVTTTEDTTDLIGDQGMNHQFFGHGPYRV